MLHRAALPCGTRGAMPLGVIASSTRLAACRALLALALAYVLILQGLFTGAAAAGQLARHQAERGLPAVLCSGAPVAGEELPGGGSQDGGHDGGALSCCNWASSCGLDPLAPPVASAMRLDADARTALAAGTPAEGQWAPPVPAAAPLGSRAPPALAA